MRYSWWLTARSSGDPSRRRNRLIAPVIWSERLDKEFTLYYDEDKLALGFGPPTDPDKTYRFVPLNAQAPQQHWVSYISIRRQNLDMPLGRYIPVAPNIFIHEGRLFEPQGAYPKDAALKLALTPRANPEDFNWKPYLNTVRSAKARHLKAYPASLFITGQVWREMGRPQRVNTYIDPIRQTITLRPDPEGAHRLHPKQSNFQQGGQHCTIASLENSTKLGYYEPIEVGRFEAIFKHKS